MKYDVFISHAGQDKEEIARPLAAVLTQRGLKVWLDEQQLHVGDSIRRGIDFALKDSRFGVIILSPAYIKSEWTNKELDAFFCKEKQLQKSILPILHNLSVEDLGDFSPMLTDKVALTTRESIDSLADKIFCSIQASTYNMGNGTTLGMPIHPQNKMPLKTTSRLLLSSITMIAVLTMVLIYLALNTIGLFTLKNYGVSNALTFIDKQINYLGDSEEQKQHKINQYKQIIAQEIVDNILLIDERLGYVEISFQNDDISTSINTTNRAIVPAVAQYFEAGINKLVAQNHTDSLRQAMNSSPLRSNFSSALTQTLADSGADVSSINKFYYQLKNVEWITEVLFGDLTKLASHKDSQNPDELKYFKKSITHTVKSLQLKSEAAHLAGLNALLNLDMPPADVTLQLTSLNHLKPNNLPSKQDLTQLMTLNMLKMQQMQSDVDALIENGKKLAADGTEEIKSLVGQLKTKPSDKPEDFFFKAATLRKLGQTEEAVLTLQQSKRVFQTMDEATKNYVDTAIAFTQQAKSFGVESGLYAASIVGEGNAHNIRLQPGDIVVEYDSKPLAFVKDILDAQQALGDKAKTQLAYLHMNQETGKFDYHKVSVAAGKLGIQFRPI